DELLRLEGVSDVSVFGQRDYSMRLWLDPQKLAAKNVTAMDVSAAIRSQNVAAAPGGVGQALSGRSRSFQFPFDTRGRLSEVDEFENIVVKATPPRRPAFQTGTGGAAGARPSTGSITSSGGMSKVRTVISPVAADTTTDPSNLLAPGPALGTNGM